MSAGPVDIVFFWFMNDWGKYGRAYEQIAAHLARREEVRLLLCIFPPLVNRSASGALKVTRAGEKLFVAERSYACAPWGRPYRVRQWVNRRHAAFILNRTLRQLGVDGARTLLWVYPPHECLDDLVAAVPHRYLIAQIIDNNAFRERDAEDRRAFAAGQYERIGKQADVVITSSESNYALFSTQARHCGYFENALDERFLGEPAELPHRAGTSRPRLGYVGFISERTDLELLRYVAVERPHYEVIIAGPQEVDLNRHGLLDLPNVAYEGVIPYPEVPAFLQTLDLCLIPHRDTRYCRSMSPLKLFQYLGSGRPVVSTAIAGTARFQEYLSVAHTYEDFVQRIDEALANDSLESSRRRIERMRQETWETRAAQMFDYVYGSYLADLSRRTCGAADCSPG